MGFFDGYDVVTSGMGAQRTRINVVSANIANAQTTHTKEGGPYKKQNVVFEELILQNQKKTESSDNSMQSPQEIAKQKDMALRGVGVKTIFESKDEPVMKFEPNHPDANDEGYVAYPNINPVVEMVDLMEAIRSYEANTQAFMTHKRMDTKTLEILRGQ